MAERAGAEPSPRRRLGILALLVVSGAAAAATAGGLIWWTQSHTDALAGSVTTSATGSRTDPLLVPVALLALAGFGAALATTGLLRRAVGGVLALGGGSAAVLAVLGFGSAPGSLRTDLTRPAESSGPARLHAAGPVLGVAGGLLVALIGLLLLTGYGARRALGARYDAPTSPRQASAAAARAVATGIDPATDPEAAARWWKALDAGQDPTASGRSASDMAGRAGLNRAPDSSADDVAEDSTASRATHSGESTTVRPTRSDPGVSDDVIRGG